MTMTKFFSLSQARSARDKLAEAALEDFRQFVVLAEAQAMVEKICRAEGDWKRQLEDLQKHCASNWNGYGIPDWSYLNEMASTIQYIADEERNQLAAGKSE